MRPPVAWPVIVPVALVELGALLVTGNRYGYHRDELYFLEAGKHPAFGYDDQPPLTPLIGRMSTALFGNDPRGLRTISALAVALLVILVALIARELGAGHRGQFIVAVGAALSFALFVGHLLSTTTFDLVLWVVIAWLVTRLLAGGDERLWLAVGFTVGVTLENKHLVLLLVAALTAGFAASRVFQPLRSRWLWAGAVVAFALWVPNLVWQARHGWPQLDLAHKIADEDPVGYRALLVPFQFVAVPTLLAPVWLAGLRRLLRDDDSRRFRPLGYGYVALLALSLVLGAKPYYTGGLLLVLLAAGGAPAERWLDRHAHGTELLATAMALSAVTSIALALPVIPVDDVHATPVPALNEDTIESIGWPRFVATVAGVWNDLPTDQRTRAVILAGNYGEAGAIDRYGPDHGLPGAYSGHNNYARWGIPPGDDGPVIVLGWSRLEYLDGFFTGCVEAARIDNGVDIDNEEQGGPVWLCAAPSRPWSQLWPDLRHLSP